MVKPWRRQESIWENKRRNVSLPYWGQKHKVIQVAWIYASSLKMSFASDIFCCSISPPEGYWRGHMFFFFKCRYSCSVNMTMCHGRQTWQCAMEDLIFFEWVLWGTAAEGRPVKPVADLLSLEQWLRKPGQCLLGAKFLLTIMAAVPCLLLPPTPALQSAQVGGCLCSREERTGFSPAHFTGGCCSVTRLCLTLCNGMDCSISSFPVLHYLLEFAQIHVHCVGDVI